LNLCQQYVLYQKKHFVGFYTFVNSFVAYNTNSVIEKKYSTEKRKILRAKYNAINLQLTQNCTLLFTLLIQTKVLRFDKVWYLEALSVGFTFYVQYSATNLHNSCIFFFSRTSISNQYLVHGPQYIKKVEALVGCNVTSSDKTC